MAYISQSVTAAALARIAEATVLSICTREVTSNEDLASSEIGRAPVRFLKGDISLTVLPIRGGDVMTPGDGKYFALSKDGEVLVSGALDGTPAMTQRLSLGNAFDLDSFTIQFP